MGEIHPEAQPAEETVRGGGLASPNLPLRPKMSNQSVKTDFASRVGLGPEGKKKTFLKEFYLLRSFRQTRRRTQTTPLPLSLPAFLLLKYICTCKTQTVLCVRIRVYVLYVKTHVVRIVMIQVQISQAWTLSQHRSTPHLRINI